MKTKKINILLLFIGLLLLTSNLLYSQAEINLTFVGRNGTAENNQLAVGLDQNATTGIDVFLGESDLPSFPPPGAFDIRFDLNPYAGNNLSSYKDYRNAPSYPFTGTVQHTLWYQLQVAGDLQLDYNLPPSVQITITDQIGGSFLNIGPFSGTGTATLPGSYTSIFAKAFLNVEYTDVSPAVNGPTFDISPASPLTIAPTVVGSSNSANLTVSNSGTASLEINGISSSNTEFSISPLAATIPVGANQVFTVTFTPTSSGDKTSELIFTHNATGSPTTYVVNGTGGVAGPAFSVTPSSLDFGNVAVLASETRTVTVSNTGLTNPLVVSNVSTSASVFTVSPSSATIPALGSEVFTVTFNPTSGVVFSGDLTFEHDASGSPSVVPLSGTGIATYGLVFAEDTLSRKEDSTYTDIIQLKSLSDKAQAVQFRLLLNKANDDNTILTFQSIEKGADVNSANWSLQYQIFRGPLTSNGASVDSIYVLLYDLNLNGGLPAGSYDSLLKVNYKVADLPALMDSAKSSLRISNAEASTSVGNPIDITPSLNELTIIVKNRVSSVGDVNGDGVLDILDLINVVDHILGRDSLDTQEFVRADIAPWIVANPPQIGDGMVNVQDLSLIQNIILTGIFPDGTTLNKSLSGYHSGLGKIDSDEADAKVIFYITNNGISIVLESKQDIRGAQIEFSNVKDNPGNMVIETKLGDGYYHQANNLLRVLLYDRQAEDIVEAGINFVANLPFSISNPQELLIDKLILVNTDKEKLGKIEIEIKNENAPGIPIDYALYQNYPNPFNPNTSIKFSVPENSFVTLKIYDMLGQEVRTMINTTISRGTYSVNWDGKDNRGINLSSGIYIYKIVANGEKFVQSKKMILLK